jgi:hypothetical protein
VWDEVVSAKEGSGRFSGRPSIARGGSAKLELTSLTASTVPFSRRRRRESRQNRDPRRMGRIIHFGQVTSVVFDYPVQAAFNVVKVVLKISIPYTPICSDMQRTRNPP